MHDLPEQLSSRLDDINEEGCWLWTGSLSRGYGYVSLKNKDQSVHRLVYELLIGPIEQGKELHHICFNKACCNPEHLKQVTRSENRLQDDILTTGNKEIFKCGHSRIPSNMREQRYNPKTEISTYVCRICERRRSRIASRRRRM